MKDDLRRGILLEPENCYLKEECVVTILYETNILPEYRRKIAKSRMTGLYDQVMTQIR